jgi:hypothetical protein
MQCRDPESGGGVSAIRRLEFGALMILDLSVVAWFKAQ